ncbi:MAG TPA: hypothetical protein VMZ26_00740 [Pyrinomonadaceae bacterium]|nr:hypothetical protein [Pyrinomonadaceae bacterium]
MKTKPFRFVSSLSLACFLALGMSSTAHAQFGGLGGLGNKVLKKTPTVGGLLEGKPPITTSLADAVWGDPSKDGFTPREPLRSLLTLQRTPNGGFILQAGYYSLKSQSYCLHAGTHGPGGGDGYLYAPTKGPAEDAVMTIVRNSVQHPEIQQQNIQTLLWAIIARAKFENLSSENRAVAARLLTPRQIASLNRSALDMVPGPVLDRAMSSVPAPIRQVMQAEASLRQMLTTPGTPYDQLERVSVLAGMAPMGEGSRDVPTGRWSLHPDGYYIRYIPSGYTNTVVQVWVPQGSPAVGIEYDPVTHMAVPGNTSRQRLLMSGRQRMP